MKKQTNTITALPFNMEDAVHDGIRQSLDNIEVKLDKEIKARQKTIDHQEQVMQRLYSLLDEKNTVILELSEKLSECSRNSEGNRQLINKLLNDIERLQQDVDWYKRTYETRSLIGILKQKLFGKRS
jgi:predicted RNase H-like nuclease (RuvC/YqgF family)